MKNRTLNAEEIALAMQNPYVATDTSENEDKLSRALLVAIEALKFYSAEDKWKSAPGTVSPREAFCDRGDKAREALAKIRGEKT